MMYEATSFECSRIAQDLQIRKVQVESVVQLFNEGNTVPFVARYRKEATGGLDEDVIRQIQTRLNVLKHVNDRKQTILKSIGTQGKLTDDLQHEILNAPTVRRLEDLYLPYKPRKKALANAAREKGLEPLALAIWHSDPAVGDLDELLPTLVNPEKQLNTVDDVKLGLQHLLAEMINETAEVRGVVRRVLWKTGALSATRNEKVPEGMGNEYKAYFQFKEATQEIRPHRILALNRGEKDSVLKVKLEWPVEQVQLAARTALAEHLLRMASTPVPQPSQPSKPSEPAPTPPPEAPPVETPPIEAPPPESPPLEVPPSEAPPVENPPPIETPPSSDAAPLVDSLSTQVAPTLTGDPLTQGVDFRSPHTAYLRTFLDDALNRLLLPSIEREIRSELTDEAELHAVKVFAHNIRSLLMQPPMVNRRVLAIDPGFRTGCKLVALDEAGNLLDHTNIYPHGGPGGGPKKGKERDKKPQAEAPANPAVETPAPEAAPSMETPITPTEVAATTTATPEMAPASETPIAEAPAPETPPAETTAAAAPTEVPPAPEPVVDKRAEAKSALVEFAKKNNVNVIALGNGAACRETEEILAEVIATDLPDMTYVIVSEAGARVYAGSPIAKEEFPNLDAAGRCAVSIGRRLQDPLSELVKIDPQSLGVGIYQHDMGRKELKETLEGVVESCVNQVGVDINAANVPLLRYVAGLNPLVAREIVEQRKNHGPITSREQLATLPGMNPTRHAQSAGFLKIAAPTNPLDRTWIHPESYGLAERVFAELGFAPGVLEDNTTHGEFRKKLNEVNLDELAKKLDVNPATLDDLFLALARPGRDPRDDMPPPIFKKGVLKLEDLQASQELKGTVLNVVDFGAFVDVGLKDSGLVHISQMANKYIKSPYDVVSVNDIVTVWVLKIDKDSNHVSLTMIKPGSERKPQERGQRPPRREGDAPPQDRGPRPPRDQRSGPPRDGQRQGGRPPRGRSGPRDQPREVTPPPPPPPPLPPRKPRREAPKPKLTQAAMEGKAPLRTLGELAAFFAAKEEKEKQPAPVVEEKTETPPPESPAGEAPAN